MIEEVAAKFETRSAVGGRPHVVHPGSKAKADKSKAETAKTKNAATLTEMVRKALHLLIALVPSLAALSVPLTLALLASGTLFYALAETSRRNGRPVLLVSRLTLIASRAADRNRFVLGPITLGLGAMVSLMLYPEPAASIAIYALAFGDGMASLVGRLVPGPRIPFVGSKSVMGSLACFAAVFVSSLPLVSTPAEAALIAFTATALEAAPSGDFDNLLVPVGTGLVAAALLGL